jgi:hypothetical protein
VNPIYYVCFSTATIVASLILFRGLNTSGGVNTLSLICGFLTTFLGVYLLNLSRSIPSSQDPLPSSNTRHHRRVSHSLLETGMFNPRISISDERQARGSFESVPTDEDEAYPLRNKTRKGTRSPGRRQSGHSPISSYNHQSGANGGTYTPVGAGSGGRRNDSPSEIVFDIGDDDDVQQSMKGFHKAS